MTVIVLNGRKFAETETEFTGSLFTGDGETCAGYWKPDGRAGIILLDHQKNRVGGIRADGMVFRCNWNKAVSGFFFQSAAPVIVGGLDYPLAQQYREAHHALGAALYGETA